MPLPFHALVPCGACGCHVRLTEKECPHCGALVRGPDGALPRTNVAVLMGLTAALLQPLACGGDVEHPDTSSSSSSNGTGGRGGGDIMVASAYGVGPTGPTFTSTGGGGNGGNGGSSDGGVDSSKGGNGGTSDGSVDSSKGGTGGRGGGDIMVASAYGVAVTVGAGGSGGQGGLAGGNGGSSGSSDGGVDSSKGGR